MNCIEKAYCRAFQFGLRISIPFLPYREPKKLTSVEMVPDVLKQRGKQRVLLVTDHSVRQHGLTARLEECLKQNGIICTVFDRTPQNPTIDAVEEAAALYRREQCQALISVGGGSAIDCGKLVGVRIARPRKSFSKMEGILKVLFPLPLHIAIPTTAGTGSETTLAAVLTDSVSHHKYAINDFPLIPKYTVLDPRLTYSLPPHLTSTTGMDAMTHAVEAYIGGSTTRSTRRYAIEAVRLINQNILTAYNEPYNEHARANMLQAAYLAGMAFTKSYVGYVHAVAHSLGGQYHTPHGLANSVLLPIVLDMYGVHAERRLARLARQVGITKEQDDHQAAAMFVARLRELNDAMRIPRHIDNINDEDIPSMAKKAAREANPLYPVPVLWNEKELERIYHAVKVNKQ